MLPQALFGRFAQPIVRGLLWLAAAVLAFEWASSLIPLGPPHPPSAGPPSMVPWSILLFGLVTAATSLRLRSSPTAHRLSGALGAVALGLVATLGVGAWCFHGLEPRAFLRPAVAGAPFGFGALPSPPVLVTVGCHALALVFSVGPPGKGWRRTQGLTLGGCLYPAIAAVGYAYEAIAAGPQALAGSPTLSLPEAAIGFAVGLNLLTVAPREGLLRLFFSVTLGGRLVRRLAAAAIGVPLVLGGFFYQSVTLADGLRPPVVALLALCLVASHLALLGWAAHLADRREVALLANARERDASLAELRMAMAEIANLRSQLITICAWSNRIKNDGQWSTLEEFLDKRLHLRISHGISDEALSELLTTVERDVWDKEQAAHDDVWAEPKRDRGADR